MEIIEQSHVVRFEKYFHCYDWIECQGAGFNFPCDKEGNMLWNEMPAPARQNYQFCLDNVGIKFIDKGIVDYSYDYREPNIGICECGEKVWLHGDDMGECSCPKCGRVYNIFGQQLKGFTQQFVGMNEYGEYYDEEF